MFVPEDREIPDRTSAIQWFTENNLHRFAKAMLAILQSVLCFIGEMLREGKLK